jgi:hypothetical protein
MPHRLLHNRLRDAVVLTILVVGAAACSDETSDEPSGPRVIELPGERVFPEGVAIDEDDTLYVGSTQDGTIMRARPDDEVAEVFLPPGGDGRTTVTGLAVRDGRLFVAGRDSARFFVYDITTRNLIAGFDTSTGDRALLNDIAVTDTAAYVTDSFRPVVWRVDLSSDEIGEPEPWLDLEGSAISYADGFNLNGIDTSEDGSTLVTVHYGTGELFRIDTTTRAIEPIDLGGETLVGGDGLEVDGTTLTIVASGDLVTIELDADLRSGTLIDRQPLSESRFPTTIALTDDEVVVVDSQLDMAGSGAGPTLPFTLSVIPRPQP